MDEARLNEIEARAKAATTGPWWVEPERSEQAGDKGYRALLLKYRWDDVPTWLAESSCHANSEANFTFLAHARQDIPDLIAEVRRLRAVIQEIDDRVNQERVPAMGQLTGAEQAMCDVTAIAREALRQSAKDGAA